jgi:tetratricopeptide (TPR) repeat protein
MFSYSPELIEKLYQMGVALLERGQIDEASKVFSFINILDPGYSACWTMLGIALRRENQWTESLKALDIALEIDEHNGLAYYHAAQCHKELNHMEEARQALDRALKEISGNPQYAHLERVIREDQSKIVKK